jgi:hypothetical protein
MKTYPYSHTLIRRMLALVGLFVAGSVMATSASAVVILQDDFNTGSGGLNTKPVPVYDSSLYQSQPTWVANNNIVFNTGAITTDYNGNGEMKVASPNLTTGTLALQADLTVATTGWIGIGFLANSSVSMFDSSNPLVVLLAPTGIVSVFKNGTSSSVYTSPVIADWNAAVSHQLRVEYNRDEGTVDVFVDQTKLNSDSIALGSLNSTVIGSVGVRIQKASSSDITPFVPQIDNFSYSSIPEPSSSALLLCGGLFGWLLWRRLSCQ